MTMTGLPRMNLRALVFACALLVIAASVAAQEAAPAQVLAYVTRVIDGDTIYAEVNGRMESIRYIGINAPELHHPTIGEQPGGRAAAEVNRQLVDGQWVTLVLDVQQRDVHGRLLAYVW